MRKKEKGQRKSCGREIDRYIFRDRQKYQQPTPPFPAVAVWREGGRGRGRATRPRLTEENQNQLPRKSDK